MSVHYRYLGKTNMGCFIKATEEIHHFLDFFIYPAYIYHEKLLKCSFTDVCVFL